MPTCREELVLSWPIVGELRRISVLRLRLFDHSPHLRTKALFVSFVVIQRGAYSAPHVQRRLVRHANRFLYLKQRRRILAVADLVNGLHPFAQWNLRAGERGADRNGELTSTFLASVETVAVRLLCTVHLCDGGSASSTTDAAYLAYDLRTHRTVRPPKRLKRHAGDIIVVEDWIGGLKGLHQPTVSDWFFKYTENWHRSASKSPIFNGLPEGS